MTEPFFYSGDYDRDYLQEPQRSPKAQREEWEWDNADDLIDQDNDFEETE